MNKVFIKRNKLIPISFKCNTYRPGLYVRAIAFYCENDIQLPVERCPNHRSRRDKGEEGNFILDYVIYSICLSKR